MAAQRSALYPLQLGRAPEGAEGGISASVGAVHRVTLQLGRAPEGAEGQYTSGFT